MTISNLLNKEYYVYGYFDPRKKGNYQYGRYKFEYEPFYIGMGKGRRFKGHLRQSARKLEGKKDYRNEYKVRIINKILQQDKHPVIKILLDKLTKKEALEKEIFFIRIIGRNDLKKGPLTNHTDGGDGCRNQSQESRRRYGQKMREKYKKGEIIAWNKGKHGIYTDDVRKGISDSLKEYYKTNKTWNKGLKGKQVAWNKNLDISDPRVKKYTNARKRSTKYKEYKFFKDGKLIIIKNLVLYCKDKNLNYRDMCFFYKSDYKKVKWENKNGVIFEYRYDNYKGYKKYTERNKI